MRINVVVFALCTLSVAGCAPTPRPAAPVGAHGPLKEFDPADPKLAVVAYSATNDGRMANIRGTVENPYDQRVQGVRYQVTLYLPGMPPQRLETWQSQVDVTLEPGEREPINLDVTSSYDTGGWMFDILATPVKVGSTAAALPEGWK